MTRPLKALLTLSAALSPVAIATAWVAIELARQAHDRRERAEDAAAEGRGSLKEARSAAAESERERLIAAGQVERLIAELKKAKDGNEALNERLDATVELCLEARAEVERLTREAAADDERHVADRAAIERLTRELADAEKHSKYWSDRAIERRGSIDHASWDLARVRRDLDAVYAIGWQAIAERDVATAQEGDLRGRLDVCDAKLLSTHARLETTCAERDAAIARAEAAERDAAQARTAEQAAYEREASVDRMHGSQLRQAKERAEKAEENAAIAERAREAATANALRIWARWAPPCACGRVSEDGCESWSGDPRNPKQNCRECYTSVPIEAAPVAPPVACTWCGEAAKEKLWTRGIAIDMCSTCYDDTSIGTAALRARHAARALAPVAAPAPAPFESPEACGGLSDVARGQADALEQFLRGETNGVPKAPTQADRDDAAVRELLTRGPATWPYLVKAIHGDIECDTEEHRDDRVSDVRGRLGLVLCYDGTGRWRLPAATPAEPTATTGREDGR